MGGQEPERRARRAGGTPVLESRRRPRPAPGPFRSAVGSTLGTVGPAAVTALIALPAATLDLPGPTTGLPLALVIIVLSQLAGCFVAREGEVWSSFRVWVVLLATTLVLLPTLAIQAASSRVPYVSLTGGSAGLVIVATLASLVAIIGTTLLAAGLTADAPEHAAILLTPALVLVPAVLGVPGDLSERSALLALGEGCGLATVLMALGWVLPKRVRPLVGLAALGAQFVVLWLLGFGPVAAPGRGFVVPALTIVILVVTVLAAAMVPIAALVTNRFAQTVRNQSSAHQRERVHSTSRSDPTRPAGRRRDWRSAPPGDR